MSDTADSKMDPPVKSTYFVHGNASTYCQCAATGSIQVIKLFWMPQQTGHGKENSKQIPSAVY